MNFLRDRYEQLASFVRDGILRGEYQAPLPTTRVWCKRLGVGRPTLLRALQILDAEGLISMTARGAILTPADDRPQPQGAAVTKVVRVLTQGDPGGHFEMEMLRLSEQLQLHGIRLVVESCSLPRLKEIAGQADVPWEFCCLLSVPVQYQKYFSPRKNSVLVIGFTHPDSPLHYLTPDLTGATRHATHSLLRKGFKRLILLERSAKTAGVAQCLQTFAGASAQWRVQPIQAKVYQIRNDFAAMRSVIKKVVTEIEEPTGIVLHAPVSMGILISALLQKGLDIPSQVGVSALEYRQEDFQFSVPITHYQVAIDRYAKEILHAALHYFETSRLPEIRKILPMSVVTQG